MELVKEFFIVETRQLKLIVNRQQKTIKSSKLFSMKSCLVMKMLLFSNRVIGFEEVNCNQNLDIIAKAAVEDLTPLVAGAC
ncbi:MAG TPA: hypothetical protein DCE56_28545 [Cyanobacteria bacterium UBA8553]|nr:hypothetical protein [Cyanobacteria bacterium UBA8553]HAJ63982.1 hypothetical protein [Cyanobacteria bacterium UBA8543]